MGGLPVAKALVASDRLRLGFSCILEGDRQHRLSGFVDDLDGEVVLAVVSQVVPERDNLAEHPRYSRRNRMRSVNIGQEIAPGILHAATLVPNKEIVLGHDPILA